MIHTVSLIIDDRNGRCLIQKDGDDQIPYIISTESAESLVKDVADIVEEYLIHSPCFYWRAVSESEH